MDSFFSRPRVGLGVIVVNEEGKILVGKRRGSHAPHYSIPGGALELGESFEDGAKREVAEETGLVINNPKVVAVVNNLETYKSEGVHFVSAILLAESFEGTPKLVEPDKCEEWLWCDPANLPEPHFYASRVGIECWKNGIICQLN